MRYRLTLAGARARWQELRAEGVPAGSMAREMIALRTYLIAIGRWREIFNDLHDAPANKSDTQVIVRKLCSNNR